MIIWALGASIGFPALNIAAMTGTRPGEEGLASGLINTSFRVGFPLGLAVLLTVAGATDPEPAGAVNPSAVAAGLVTGFQYALLAAALLGVLGFIIALRIKEAGTPPVGNREPEGVRAELKKVVEAVGKDSEAPPLWEKLTSLVGPGRSIAMGEFDEVAL